MKPTMARERRALGKSILKKKEMVERAIIRIIHNKSLKLHAEEFTCQGLKSSFSCTSIP
jgi:hypothetical protein